MNRDDAIEILCAYEVSQMTSEQRKEYIESLGGEDVLCEILQIKKEDNPSDDQYDVALAMSLSYGYQAVTNSYLLAQLKKMNKEVDAIEGEPETFQPCPCCGYCTLESYGDDEVCPLCDWKDNGQNNDNADKVFGDTSLTKARFNFLKNGSEEPKDKYQQSRQFEIGADGKSVCEPSANWTSSSIHE